jgi:hypothetical protein
MRSRQHDEARVSIGRQALILVARNDLQQLLEPCGPLCSRNAELGQMRRQGIDHLSPASAAPVTELREFTRPIMSRGAGLHADEAWWQRFEERQHLAAPELLPNDDLFVGVDPVDLEHVLGDIQTDRGNLRWSRLSEQNFRVDKWSLCRG